MHTTKCHRCGKTHKTQSMLPVWFESGEYYYLEEQRPSGLVLVGTTCFSKINFIGKYQPNKQGN